ncbi:MAG: hypothetical protein FJZ58_03345, partial [Chlamydiae bacterium]|nr:hypothetical protein [Chlamydiota bacterium]
EPFYRSLFFYILFSIVITGVLLPFEQTTSVFSLSQKDLIFLFSMGISAFFTQVFLSLSIKYAPSKLIAPFAYLSLIFSLSIDVIFWGKIPCMAEMLGMGFIMAGLGLFLFVASKPGLSQKASLSNE